ncbi:MAG: M13 family metallopeptidase N-terminal domain-containing protein, partial [Sphingobium sp.]
MRPSILVAILASTALGGCAAGPGSPRADTSVAAPVSAPASAGPQYGAYGFDTAGMDRAVAPGDDFYGYANGTWAKATPIPADKSNYGLFTVLDELSRSRTRDILDAAKDDPASKIGNAYAAYLDQQTVEAKGLAPIRPWLDAIRAVRSKADYARLIGTASRNGVDGPFAGYVGQDDKAPESYIFTMAQSGIGLPDRDYYLLDTPPMKAVRTAYVAHLARMFALAGEADGAARAAAILSLESRIAKVHWNRADSRDADKTYNKLTLAELMRRAPGFDFAACLDAQGLGQVKTMLVAQPSAVAGEARIIASAPLAVLKDIMLIRSLGTFADELPDAIANENFAFYGTVLSGTPER